MVASTTPGTRTLARLAASGDLGDGFTGHGASDLLAARRNPRRGVGLNPGTPLAVLEPLLDELEFILILAVNPGWGGQKFIASTRGRVEKTRHMIAASGREILLGVDGGITRDNIDDVAALGVDLIVTGSAVFDGKAAEANAKFMLEAVKGKAVGSRQ